MRETKRKVKEVFGVFSLLVQAVHVEMGEALHEKDELKLRVHSYISEVSRIEKLMATKARGRFACESLEIFTHPGELLC